MAQGPFRVLWTERREGIAPQEEGAAYAWPPLPAALDRRRPQRRLLHREGWRQLNEEREQMAWFVHYWDEINDHNIRSSEIRAREDAMRKACSLMREGYVVSHVAGPNGERVDIVDIRAWCSAHASN